MLTLGQEITFRLGGDGFRTGRVATLPNRRGWFTVRCLYSCHEIHVAEIWESK